MNKNETQVLIDYTKGMITDNKEPEKKVIIALCNELERINKLEPVDYVDDAELLGLLFNNICYLYKDIDDKINIPFYRRIKSINAGTEC